MPQLVAPLRGALSSPDAAVTPAACLALSQLAECIGSALISTLPQLLVPLGRLHADAAQRPAVRQALAVSVARCGAAALPLVRSKLPGYQG